MLFILGPTRSGKSTLARKVADLLAGEDPVVVSGGGWVRARLPPECTYEQRAAYALGALRLNPNAALDYLEPLATTCRPTIVEGLRNPRDFCRLWNPATDVVVLTGGLPLLPGFEAEGVRAIQAVIDFHVRMGLMEPWRLVEAQEICVGGPRSNALGWAADVPRDLVERMMGRPPSPGGAP